jgi:hypothetical protein
MIISLEMTPEAMRDRIYTMMRKGVLKNDELTRGQIDFDSYDAWARAYQGQQQAGIHCACPAPAART